jgi:hypothetical protein
MPRKPPPATKRGPSKLLPEEMAGDAIAHEDEAPGGKVRMTFRVGPSRGRPPKRWAARAIQEEKNLALLVTEILEAAASTAPRSRNRRAERY